MFCDFGDSLGKCENPGRLSPECGGTMGVFFGEILEVIAKHFNFEKSIYQKG